MKRLTLFIPLAIVLITAVSCKKGGLFCYKSDGTSVSELRDHQDFSEIHLSMAATVYVTQSTEYSVEVVAAENLLPIIETEQKGDKLEIDLKRGKCLKGSSDVKVYISTPNIEELNISGSGSIYVDNYLSTQSLKINISGSGDVDIDSLSNERLEINISGSGEVEMTSLDTAQTQEIDISGSGSISALYAPALQSDIHISGSGGCDVHVIESLDANISGSGDVRYLGNPNVTSNISGSGSVSPY